MPGLGPDAFDILTANDWEFLLNRTILYATGHVNRWYWRGAEGGVLPGGHNPNSIAAQAITDFLQQHSSSSPNGQDQLLVPNLLTPHDPALHQATLLATQ